MSKLIAFKELPEQQQGEILDHMSLAAAKMTKWELILVEPDFVYKQWGLPGTDINQVRKLKQAIQRQGFTTPLVVDGIKGWMEGNHRAVAASDLGLPEIPAYVRER